MSDIMSLIEGINTSKGNIKTAIEGKGVTVSEDKKLADYFGLISSITAGTGQQIDLSMFSKHITHTLSVSDRAPKISVPVDTTVIPTIVVCKRVGESTISTLRVSSPLRVPSYSILYALYTVTVSDKQYGVTYFDLDDPSSMTTVACPVAVNSTGNVEITLIQSVAAGTYAVFLGWV